MHRLTVTLSTAFIILASANASAQSALASRPSVSLSAGAFFFDLSGTGVAPMAVVRGDLPLNRFIAFDGGLIGALPTQDFLERTTLLAPEIGMQLQVPRRFAPYLSADIGRIFAIRGSSLGGTRNDVSYSAALGARCDQRATVRRRHRPHGRSRRHLGRSRQRAEARDPTI